MHYAKVEFDSCDQALAFVAAVRVGQGWTMKRNDNEVVIKVSVGAVEWDHVMQFAAEAEGGFDDLNDITAEEYAAFEGEEGKEVTS